MAKQPSIKINDRIWRYLDDNEKFFGTYIRLTEKGIRCKWDNSPEKFTTVLLYKDYGTVWEKVKHDINNT
ncbi:hypothetical protein IQ247_06235 [Plectonema cf. radiosum LEGE 06105]|uniref:Uncharacterized protein n=1 Tax=Plectonema cf. radiosum LEGE 06105 TaxID=945769 RepID=A0A8J7JSA5_9CYAN|nr:hypothetical protein [Plectonema radiosum]MBE9212309.1 hypothetical protein [Plectonema cf. radiosum LEGE 06105]